MLVKYDDDTTQNLLEHSMCTKHGKKEHIAKCPYHRLNFYARCTEGCFECRRYILKCEDYKKLPWYKKLFTSNPLNNV